MVHPIFNDALLTRYEAVKSQYPTEGRRKWRLRVLYDSWLSFPSVNVSESGQVDSNAPVTSSPLTSLILYEDLNTNQHDTDPDPLDPLLADEELGLIIRTDFSDDDAWNTFCQKVQEAQKDLLSDLSNGNAQPESSTAGGGMDSHDTSSATDDTNVDADSDSPSEAEADIIKILNPSDPADKLRLTNISNLTALRLFNDVDVRETPIPRADMKRISPSNPLIDQGGWQEIYRGKNIWIYDSQSLRDECIRVISQQGDFYGTATGDSWRARGTHVPELQFNLSYQGMKIDFNGLDKWDWDERMRNLNEHNNL